MSIRILIVDDIDVYVNKFKKIISNVPDISVVGVAYSGNEAKNVAKELKPDVILMDVQMENDTAGIDTAREILEDNPDIKIIICTIHDDDDLILSAFDAGVCDYILKTSPPEEIISIIYDAMEYDERKNKVNKVVKSEMIKLRKERKSILFCANLISRLSAAELDVLKLLLDGYTYQQIADARFCEQGTIRVIVNKISKKLSGTSIREIIEQMKNNGILELIKLLNDYKTD